MIRTLLFKRDLTILLFSEWYKHNFFTTYRTFTAVMFAILVVLRASASPDTVGSCSMLPREDAGVVDTKLKVYTSQLSPKWEFSHLLMLLVRSR